MSKISYSVMKKLKIERLLKRQSNFDNVIVFDEEFEMKYNLITNKNYWLTFVDFSTTYKYDPNGSCLKTASYKDIVDKANEWIRQLPQYKRNDRLIPGQPIWSVINCETLYAKISINFNESGEITRKRVMQYSKWPLNDELFMNLYCENNTMNQNFEQIFNGRYIVVLLRVWLTKHPYFPLMMIGSPITICIKDYWPQKITIEEQMQNNFKKSNRKALEIKKKLKRTLSIDAHGGGSSSSSNHHHHNNDGCSSGCSGEVKECLEKIHEVTNRINSDIIERKIDGHILNVITFPCYYNNNNCNKENIQSETKIEFGKIIPIGHIVNLIRVFYIKIPQTEFNDNNNMMKTTSKTSSNLPKELIAFEDFIPRCISAGGLIKYPRFETQTDLIDKATMWITKNRKYKLLNFSSVDIKLKSMTSIDTGEMTFTRNTGDFVRILRLCYLKPFNSTNNNNNNDNNMINLNNDNISDNKNRLQTINNTDIADIINWEPSPPVYLQRKNIVSINNSIKELQQQMNDYLLKVRRNELIKNEWEKWKFLCADSVAIFISNSTNSGDSRNRRNNLLADCDKSFHAISISTTNMNRNMLNGIQIYYDIGMLGQQQQQLKALKSMMMSNNANSNDNGNDSTNNQMELNQRSTINDRKHNNNNMEFDEILNNNNNKKDHLMVGDNQSDRDPSTNCQIA